MKYLLGTVAIIFWLAVNSQNGGESQAQRLFIDNIQQTKATKAFALGTTIYQGVFTGNGLLGTMTHLKDDHTVKVNIGRTDVYDRRTGEDNLFARPRLPIGSFEIRLSEPIIETMGRMDIYNAESVATISTALGTLHIKARTLAEENYILIEMDDPQYKGTWHLSWQPAISESPRANFDYVAKPAHYQPNPPVTLQKSENLTTSFQQLLAGGSYCIGYQTKKIDGKNYVLVATDYQPKTNTTQKTVSKALKSFNWNQLPEKLKTHQNWWHRFYTKSALNIPDRDLQDFYNLQLYKLASATRSDKPAIDLQGPWTDRTPWPGYWFNLNIQLTYSPLYTANQLGLAESLIKMIDKNVRNLKKNVPAPYQYNSIAIGRSGAPDLLKPVKLIKGDTTTLPAPEAELSNLTWMLFYYYQHYDVTRDPSLRIKVVELLKKSINYYLHLLEKNKEGKYQLSVRTYSPEYPKGYAYNTNYDLSVLKWGLKTLIKLALENGSKEPLLSTWQEVYQHLIDYPKDETGFLIAQGVPYEQSHRHYSHLMMIYPFYDIHWDQLENRALIEKSIQTWQSKPQALQGYSLTGHASMKAMMGKGGEARDILKSFIKRFVKPNTLYAETGPVIETPLAAMQSIQELYVQYWDEVVRVFPAVPEDWANCSFENLRVPGAFLLSGKRENFKNVELSIFSEKGGKITLQPHLSGTVQFSGTGKLVSQIKDRFTLEIPKGGAMTLSIKEI